MVRVITQETFDSVVKENVQELEMSASEAVLEAKAQFEAQGVNLDNIVIPGEDGGHTVLKALEAINNTEASNDQIIEECKKIEDECKKGLPERILATQHHAYDTLIKVSLEKDIKSVEVAAMKALTNLLEGNPDPLEPQGFKILMAGLNSDHAEMVKASLECALNVCVRHEMNRQNLVRNGLLNSLKFEANQIEVCHIWQALVQDDDIRVPFGSAHDHARQIVEDHEALSKLKKALESADHDETAQYLACLSSLSVRNEYCAAVAADNGLSRILGLLNGKPEVVRDALRLLKTLAGNDSVKREIGETKGVVIVVEAMQKNIKSKPISQLGCGALTAICLRSPDNAKDAVKAGTAKLLTQILELHVDAVNVMIAACSAIRNIVSRARELTADFVELDVEALLHGVQAKHPQKCEDAVKAALRDLGLKVNLKEQWTGGAVDWRSSKARSLKTVFLNHFPVKYFTN